MKYNNNYFIQINYFGMIRQTTGEDWNETQISLSTAVPSIGGNIPEINAENVRMRPEYRPMPRMMKAKSSAPGKVQHR